MPDPTEHATGVEKQQKLLEQQGIYDPFHIKPIKRKKTSTRDDPNWIPSVNYKRIVACKCEETDMTLWFLWVHKDKPIRCRCGHWFQCYKIERMPGQDIGAE